MSGRPRRSSHEVDDLIIQVLRSARRGMTAYGVIGRLERRGQIVAPTQIYRAMQRLIDRGALRRVETLNTYVIVNPRKGGQSALFCRCCNSSLMVDTDAPIDLLLMLAAEHGFRADRSVAEIAGTCPACTGAESERTVQAGSAAMT